MPNFYKDIFLKSWKNILKGQPLFSRFAADDDDIKGTISSVTRPSKKVFPRPKKCVYKSLEFCIKFE